MSMDHVPRLTAHHVGKARGTKLFANPRPYEVTPIFPEDGVNLLARQCEGWQPPPKEQVRSLPVRLSEHVREARKQVAKLRRLVPRSRGLPIHHRNQ